MNVRRALTMALLLGLAVLAGACRSRPGGGVQPPLRPRPVVGLAGQSYAYVGADYAFLPQGPGADGRPGDLLLENAFVRFVVAAAGHHGPAGSGGHLIDAAVQGGEDQMRLLLPLLGGRKAAAPVYEEVSVSAPGGVQEEAAVVSTGHLPGDPSVEVETTYTLRPGSRMLEMSTTVRNRTDSMRPFFGFRDLLYHGRTMRFAPRAGLFPAGKSPRSRWLAFFGDGCVWGVLAAPLGTLRCVHSPGVSEIGHRTVDIPPGQSRTCRRYLMCDVGGPERVWLAAFPPRQDELSHLSFVMRERGTDDPIPGVQIDLTPSDERSPFLMVTDEAGAAATQVPAGAYEITLGAAGRDPVSFTVKCGAGLRHRCPITLSRRAEARVTVRARVGPYTAPTPARIFSGPARGFGESEPVGVPFPTPLAGELAFADQSGRATLWLAPSPFPTLAAVVASRGPLFSYAVAPVQAEVGASPSVELLLERLVEPGEYVAVDFRQHTGLSLDCALLSAERALTSAAEGLDAAVVSDPVFRAAVVGVPRDADCRLVPGFRFRRHGVGSFSVFPLDAAEGAEPDLSGVLAPGLSADEVLAKLRELFPTALIQVDDPLDEGAGYFELCGFAPTLHRHSPAGFSEDFDAIELLTGRDVAGARQLLPYWFWLLNKGRRIMVTGGSGSRAIQGDVAGLARTFVHCPAETRPPSARDVVAAIRSLKEVPDAFVSNGPFIEARLDGHPIGSVQTARAEVAELRLKIAAAPWVDVRRVSVYRNGTAAHQFDLAETEGTVRWDDALEVDTSADCWFVVRVEGDRPMRPVYGGPHSPTPFAVTNPFWVDADGDGQVTVPE